MNAETAPAPASRSLDSLPAHGVWSPVLVPLRPDLGIDSERFLAHARRLLAQGCHGLALFGTTSEANSFSVAERKALVERVVESGIPPERLMIGAGCCALTDSVELTRHALDAGCRRVLMLPPFYYKGVGDEGLFHAFAEVVERVGDPALQVFLYHFPRLSGVPVTEGLIALLTDAFPGTVAGVKDSSGDWSNTRMMLERFPDLAIFPGSEVFLLDGLRAGGAGCITATSNVNAAGARAIFDAWEGGARRPRREAGGGHRGPPRHRPASGDPGPEVPPRPPPGRPRVAHRPPAAGGAGRRCGPRSAHGAGRYGIRRRPPRRSVADAAPDGAAPAAVPHVAANAAASVSPGPGCPTSRSAT